MGSMRMYSILPAKVAGRSSFHDLLRSSLRGLPISLVHFLEFDTAVDGSVVGGRGAILIIFYERGLPTVVGFVELFRGCGVEFDTRFGGEVGEPILAGRLHNEGRGYCDFDGFPGHEEPPMAKW